MWGPVLEIQYKLAYHDMFMHRQKDRQKAKFRKLCTVREF